MIYLTIIPIGLIISILLTSLKSRLEDKWKMSDRWIRESKYQYKEKENE